jgi:hypothetical protein
MKLLEIMSLDFDVIHRLLARHVAFVKCWRRKWGCNGTAHWLFLDFKKAFDSVRREVLYNILIEFDIP